MHAVRFKSIKAWRLLAAMVLIVSFPALAAYKQVRGTGSGATYQMARSSAVNMATMSCMAARGSLTSVIDSSAYQNSLGYWTVSVYGTCFVYP